MDEKDRLLLAMGEELLRMSRQLSRVAEKKMSDQMDSKIHSIICSPSGLRPPAVLDVLPPTNFHQAVEFLLKAVGEDPTRDGLRDTPERFRKAWEEMLSGYRVDIEKLFKHFEENGTDEMIIVRDIAFTSFCEHHLLPFTGVAHVAYIPPAGKIIGLSKVARVVEAFSKRLQVQERLTSQITGAFSKYIPGLVGVGCKVTAKHFCMCARGVKQPGADMVTTSLLGALRHNQAARAEFFSCVGSS